MSCYFVLSPPVSGQLLSALPLPTSPSTGGPVEYFFLHQDPYRILLPPLPTLRCTNLVDPTHPFNLLTPMQSSCHHPCRGSSGLPFPRLRPLVFRWTGLESLQVNTQSVLNPTPRSLSPARSYISSHAYNVICTLSSRHHPRRGNFCPSPAYPLSPARYDDLCMSHMITLYLYTVYRLQHTANL